MKICSKCKIEKNLYEFTKNKTTKDGYTRYCKPCKKIADKKWFNENPSIWKKGNSKRNEKIKEIIFDFRDYLGGKCEKCGENRKHLLDFHHKNPTLKEEIISNILVYYGYSEKSIKKAKEEVDKCILLCSNCHRDFHYLEKENNINLEKYLNGC
jgi:protein-arginine kinase activator protein McsA